MRIMDSRLWKNSMEEIKKRINGLKKAAGRKISLSIGFKDESIMHPSGVPLVQIAEWNEYGREITEGSKNYIQVPRPFMQRTIDRNSEKWNIQFRALSVKYGFDTEKAMIDLAEIIKKDLQQEIIDFVSPALKQSTIDKKGFDKPLIDTGFMLEHIDVDIEIK
jgi:hypothetical protein